MKRISRQQTASPLAAVREALRADRNLDSLSAEETAMLTSQLTTLLARVERVRSLGPGYAGIDLAPDVHELLVRLEAGSNLATGVH